MIRKGGNVLIKLDGMTITLEGQRVLNDFSIEIAQGEWIQLQGPHVCQLVVKALEGTLRPTEGHFYYEGVDTQCYSASQWAHLRKKQLIIMSPKKGLMNHFDVEKNIQMQLKYGGVYPTKWKRQSQRVLEELEILSLRNREIETLGSLERWQVKLAKALVAKPKFIVIEGVYEELKQAEIKEFVIFCKEKIPVEIGVIFCTENRSIGVDESFRQVKL
ncbi:ABC-type antimicrobial peptide transport system ATPase component-like protein [Alkaliphilus metalliredigens QYMF]|uniref:ABC-type antimicrobial peptide transport system ATPase component-like protein n=1 Tax=Alkaliphilus metalliredigens (strain QYMF) TaxID=293826 RepID=A6TLG3_ALKMQ|nr:ABC-type antimicrobial peptide transport system ATPase component-like protein [Alkaliphilus metalliredigens QYMF]